MHETLDSSKKYSISSKTALRNGKNLMIWRKQRGINRSTFARLANCSERKMATYEKATKLPLPVRRQASEAVRLLQALGEIISEEAISDWLRRPNTSLDRRVPLAIIEAGESDLLWDMIYQTRQSTFA